MSPDVIFAAGLSCALVAAFLGGWLLRGVRDLDEALHRAYWDGYGDARAQAEEFIVRDDHEAAL